MSRLPAALLALALLGLGPTARADVVKRALPDYDGRGDPPTTAGDVLIWIPRVAVSPLYLVTEYLIRRPIGWLVVTGERNQWPMRIMDFLFDRPVGIVPTFFVDLGLRPTAGFYFFWNGLGGAANEIRITASFSAGVITATALDRVNLGAWQLALRGHLDRRSDNLFYGLGPDSDSDDESRFKATRFEGSLAAQWRFGGASRARLELGERIVRFGEGGCCDQPSIADRVEEMTFASPAGFAEGGYDGPFARLRLVLDSRERAPETGLALFVDLEQGSDVGRDHVWLKSSATLVASLDVNGRRRVFSLILHGALADPLAGDDVPFTEQVTLGGNGHLPGFGSGRLVGRSAVAATLTYEWPVWAYLGGVLHAGVGDVFGERFDGFDTGLLRLSSGIGIRSLGRGDHRFEMVLALGTLPFDEGGRVDSVRLVLGGTAGF